ncbi:MAG: uracil-DNA glycosylase [Actinomycetota bacterium]
MLFESMDPSWQQLLATERELLFKIERELEGVAITPKKEFVMRAFSQPIDSIRVVLLGQDPYPTKGVAIGLAFAVSEGTKSPQSLKNMMRELKKDIPDLESEGEITRWEKSGVMLLNSALTTLEGHSGSHAKLWREFTQRALASLASAKSGKLVVMALGDQAKKLALRMPQVVIVDAAHPSPLSAYRGFFGSKVFSRVNKALISLGEKPIDWSC